MNFSDPGGDIQRRGGELASENFVKYLCES
jgi:hypothetical protein